jgi:hypothetical protein
VLFKIKSYLELDLNIAGRMPTLMKTISYCLNGIILIIGLILCFKSLAGLQNAMRYSHFAND